MSKKKDGVSATNAEYAQSNGDFRKFCVQANVEPTKRQACKYRKGKGRAYKIRLNRFRRDLGKVSPRLRKGGTK